MFDVLPDAFSKVSLRKALFGTVGFGVCTGICIGQFVTVALRLSPSAFEYVTMSILTLLYGGLTVRYCLLTLSRIDEPQHTTAK